MSTETTPTKPTVQELVKGMLTTNTQVRQAVLDSVVHKKPAGWSRRSRAVYYSEFFALQMKKTVDAMLLDKQDCIFEYSSFPDISHNTLYQRINQSMRYLVDCMDTAERTYGKFNEMVRVSKIPGKSGGIKLMWREQYRDTPLIDFTPHRIIPESDKPKWRAEMDKYIESNDTGARPFIRDGLCLTPDEMKQLKTEFVGTESTLLVDIKSNCIKIVKIG